MWMFKNCYN